MTHRCLMIEDSFQMYADSQQYGNFDEQSQILYKDFSEEQPIEEQNDNGTTESINERKKGKQPQQIRPNFGHQATKRIVKMFAGETKNLPKNLCRAIKSFIDGLFSQQQIQSNPALRKFMNKAKQRCGKEDIDDFLSTEIGRKIGDMFFGNLKFTSFFVRENKVDLDPYFRVLDEYFSPIAVQEQ